MWSGDNRKKSSCAFHLSLPAFIACLHCLWQMHFSPRKSWHKEHIIENRRIAFNNLCLCIVYPIMMHYGGNNQPAEVVTDCSDQCAVRESWIFAFMWLLFDMKHLSKHCTRPCKPFHYDLIPPRQQQPLSPGSRALPGRSSGSRMPWER